MWARVNSIPGYLSVAPHQSHPPQPCSMPASVSWAAGDPTPNLKSNSTMTVALDGYIEALTAAKSTVEITPVKAVFESTIAILTLIRVKNIILFLFSHPLIRGTTRTRLQTTIRSWNWPNTVPKCATC